MIDAVIYGMIPSANTDRRRILPPANRSKKPKIDEATDDLRLKLKGTWINVDEGSLGDTRITIENKDDNDKTNQGWTALCTKMITDPNDKQKKLQVKADKLKLHMLLEIDSSGDPEKSIKKDRVVYGFATWDNGRIQGFGFTGPHLIFRMEGELLVVETYAVGHPPHYHLRCEYKKEK